MLLTPEREALLRRAITVFGMPAQWEQVIEECAELIVAIRHFKRERATRDQVAEEVADVLIMAEQARQMIGPAIVDRIVTGKLARLERRVAQREHHRRALSEKGKSYDPSADTGDVG